MNKFPFISLQTTLVLVRINVAIIFMSHAGVRMWGGTIERFGDFLNAKGFVFGVALVWVLTLFELVGGLLLAFGIFTRWLACVFFMIIALGIVLIHASNGWFVGEHGTGGMEYSVLLLVVLVVLMVDNVKAKYN